ncbi:unnamed protein product [Echinostoma caproni]|uniref:Semialdhyde_dh domain-containing protein n=1 Tax=Echinostoma caproni TaxID=27848 RepID=A0A183B309_9TREM|nr:unnamed protein product [Echinostoma caproni]
MSIAVRAFVVGYTGETGKALVKALARDPRYTSVKLIGRRQVELDFGIPADKIVGKFSQHVIDFDHLEEHQLLFEDTDVGFSALGTTIAKSGAELMRKIDHDYVLQVAELAVACGCKEFGALYDSILQVPHIGCSVTMIEPWVLVTAVFPVFCISHAGVIKTSNIGKFDGCSALFIMNDL